MAFSRSSSRCSKVIVFDAEGDGGALPVGSLAGGLSSPDDPPGGVPAGGVGGGVVDIYFFPGTFWGLLSQARVASATIKRARGVHTVHRPDRNSREGHKMRRHKEGSI